MYAKITILGNIGSVEDLRYTSSGVAVFNFSVATSSGKGDAKKTQWYRVAVWREYAETMSKILKKGNKVFVEGDFEAKLDEKDGKTYLNLNITASKIFNLSEREEGTTEYRGSTGAETERRDLNPNDIPF